MLKKAFRLGYAGALLFISQGCTSLPARQTPKIVEEGSRITGIGATYLGSPQSGDRHLGPFDLYMRLPLQEKVDVGFRVSGYFPTSWYMIGMDMRYQVKSGAPMAAAGLGFGVDMSSGVSGESTFVFGSETLYGGIRLHYLALSEYFGENYMDKEDGGYYSSSSKINTSYRLYRNGFIPGLFIGASLGKMFRVMPESGFVLGANGRPYLYGAISVEWTDLDNKPRAVQLPPKVESPSDGIKRVELPKPGIADPVNAPK